MSTDDKHLTNGRLATDEPMLFPPDRRRAVHTARMVLVPFLFTFVAARMLVFLIMTQRIPDLFLHIGDTHVHHLNYGIFLLTGVGAYLLFYRPTGRALSVATAVYGVALGLTFDEFGMWLHLGGSYWQRASFDAIVVIAALLGIIAAAPYLRDFRPRHWTTAMALGITILVFILVLSRSTAYARHVLAPRLHEIEAIGPK